MSQNVTGNLPEGGPPGPPGQTGPPAAPTPAFVGASWAALLAGLAAYLIALWNTPLTISAKGYYLTLLLYGLFAAVSLQKSARDRFEGIPVTRLYYGLCWFAVVSALLLLAGGVWSAPLSPSEKGFFAMSFVLSLFASVAVGKNVRDLVLADRAFQAGPGGPGTGAWRTAQFDQFGRGEPTEQIEEIEPGDRSGQGERAERTGGLPAQDPARPPGQV